MRALTLIALMVLGQESSLDEDFRATVNDSRAAMVTLIATYPDGSPARGQIRCAGIWFKHADETELLVGEALPFETDSRGAVIVNPHVSDEWIECWSESRGYYGRVRVYFQEAKPTGVGHIRMRLES